MKKKKKSSKKKAAFDLEAFEKELNESKKESGEGKKTKDEDEDEDDGPVDTSHLDNLDETELGDNPFSRPDAPVGVDAGTEAWLSSDRDYTYPEVRFRAFLFIPVLIYYSSSRASTHPSMPPILPSSPPHQNDTPSHLLPFTKKETKRPSLPTSPIFAKKCTVRFVMVILSTSYIILTFVFLAAGARHSVLVC